MDRWLNYIHRDDAAAALHLLCTLREPPAGIYNLTDRTPMPNGRNILLPFQFAGETRSAA